MAEAINFTKQNINQQPLPAAGKRLYLKDTKVDGLQLTITDKGTKTFNVYKKINGTPKRITIGHYPDMTPENARAKAYGILNEIANGNDPQIQKKIAKSKTVNLQTALDDYLTTNNTIKDNTKRQYRQVITSTLSDWLKKPVIKITKDMVVKRHQKIGKERGEATANQCMRYLRAILNYASYEYEDAEGNSLLPNNPVKGISQRKAWYRVKRRQTLIKSHELPSWFEAVLNLKNEGLNTSAETVSDALITMVLTGLRKNEALRLKWTDIDLKDKSLTVQDTKNHEDHALPLSDYLFELLEDRKERSESEYVFPGNEPDKPVVELRRQMRKVTDQSGIEFTLHDLRRTFITIAESLDIPAYALKQLLNHKDSNDVTAGYIVTDVHRLRKPMQQITDFILSTAKIKSKATLHSLPQVEENNA